MLRRLLSWLRPAPTPPEPPRIAPAATPCPECGCRTVTLGTGWDDWTACAGCGAHRETGAAK